jgi:hypothetical protein
MIVVVVVVVLTEIRAVAMGTISGDLTVPGNSSRDDGHRDSG